MTFVYIHSPLGLPKKKLNLPFVIKFSLASYIILYHLTAYSYSYSSLFFSFLLSPFHSQNITCGI